MFNNRWLIIDSPDAQAVDWIVSCSYQRTQELQVDPIDVRYQHKSQSHETVNRPEKFYPSPRAQPCAPGRSGSRCRSQETNSTLPAGSRPWAHVTANQVMHALNNTILVCATGGRFSSSKPARYKMRRLRRLQCHTLYTSRRTVWDGGKYSKHGQR